MRNREHVSPEVSWKESAALFFRKHHLPTDNLQNHSDELRTLRDAPVEHIPLSEFFTLYGIESLPMEELGGDIFRFSLSNTDPLPVLPEGYGFAGGAARAMLQRALGFHLESPVRDLDLVRDVARCPDSTQDNFLANKYNSADAERLSRFHPNPVEHFTEISEYFATRDFTINEVICFGKEVYATDSCIRDMVRHIIRITEYQKDRDGLSSKMLAKIMRMWAEGVHRYGEFFVADEDVVLEVERGFVEPFWLALQLDKVCHVSDGAAQSFVAALNETGQIPKHIKTVESCAAFLLDFVSGFYYRYAPVEQFEKEEDLVLDDMYEKYPIRTGHSRGYTRKKV